MIKAIIFHITCVHSYHVVLSCPPGYASVYCTRNSWYGIHTWAIHNKCIIQWIPQSIICLIGHIYSRACSTHVYTKPTDLWYLLYQTNNWRASVASETLTGVTQLKIGDVCLFICIYVWTYVRHFCTLTLAFLW